jgi:hypothetical protein
MIFLWVLALLGFLGSIINFILFFTFLKAIFRNIDKMENLEIVIDELNRKKVDRPVPPPDIVPLERM